MVASGKSGKNRDNQSVLPITTRAVSSSWLAININKAAVMLSIWL